MFKALFNIILNLLASLVQLVCYPFNLLIENALPDLSTKITLFTSNVQNIFGNFAWIIDILPDTFLDILLFIVTLEIAKYTCYVSLHGVIKVWNLFQKLKFW